VTASRIQFADEQYFVKEGDTLEVTLIRTGVLPTVADRTAGEASVFFIVTRFTQKRNHDYSELLLPFPIS